MAEVTKYPVENELGCGLMAGIFHRRNFWLRKTSVHSLPTGSSNNISKPPNTDITSKNPPTSYSEKKRSIPETTFLESSNLRKPSSEEEQKHTRKLSLVPRRTSTSQKKNQSGRPSDVARSSISTSLSSGQTRSSQNHDSRPRRKSISDVTELNRAVTGNHHPFNEGKALVRATTGNTMILGRLGNLRQGGNGNHTGKNSPSTSIKTVDYLERNYQEFNLTPRTRNVYSKLGGNGLMGNILRQTSVEEQHCQALVTITDPEVLKNMGNDKYKKGKFEEALVLYDRAISLDPTKAAYRSNKSAALIGIGRLMEAIAECEEAIRLDPSYQRAHHRLATLYVRVGEAEKALHHYRQSSPNNDPKDIAQTQALQKHLNRCIEARELKEWNILLKETEHAMSSGVDSSPQIYAMQAEALLRLNQHQEAYRVYQNGPDFGIDACTKFFGLTVTSHFLMIRALVCMAAGRFEDGLSAAQQAARLNPSDKEVGRVVKSARAVASARLSGNLLFKASKVSEACNAYSEGLEHDPCNSILLCNRAACRSRLGQFEKAVEDCTVALTVQPNYTKARLRRAHCNAKLERWEASIQDYETLIRECPADEEIGRALFEAQLQLKKKQGEDTKDLKFGCNLVFISSNGRFRHYVTSPGMSVVLFCNKDSNRHELQVMEEVCKKFPSVNFLKVEVEEHPYLVKSEGVTSLPAFKIYKNGSRVKDIPGNKSELLANLVKLYSS